MQDPKRFAHLLVLIVILWASLDVLASQPTPLTLEELDRDDINEETPYAFNRGYYTLFHYANNNTYDLRPGNDLSKGGVAVGRFHDDIATKGWSQLWVTGSDAPAVTDEMKAYGAGFIEGALTNQRIWDYWRNIMGVGSMAIWGSNPAIKPKIVDWLMKQQTWSRQNSKTNSSALWRQVSLVQTQLYGILDGYNRYAPKNQQMSLEDMVLLNSFPDSLDIINVVAPELRPNWFNLTAEEAIHLVYLRSHCSSLVKLLRGAGKNSESTVMTGHTTWIFYSMLVRIFKYIELPFKEPSTANRLISFSSYPGQIVSADDYYTIDDKMVVTETSNNIFNMKLYDKVTPQSLLFWQRAALANRMARSGKEWVDIFSAYNSGTYNNQWIIVDHRRLNQPDGLLWVAEQIPGKVAGADLSDWLRNNSYWASYNIPFFKDIYDASGYSEMYKKYGNDYSWDHCPRANIFRRNESMVLNIQDMEAIMTYNNYLHDPLENHDPMWAISSRGDLSAKNPTPMGGLDSKLTSNRLRGESLAICSPSHVDLPPFEWTGQFLQWPHFGQPKVWNFGWLHMNPHA